MGYNRRDNFPFVYIPFNLKLNEKLKGKEIVSLGAVKFPGKQRKSRKNFSVCAQTVPNRLTAVPETGVSEHQGGLIEGSS